MLFRHGDIPLYPVTGKFDGKLISHNGSFVLAEGETTGHMHVLTVDDPEALRILETAEGIVLELDRDGTITHQEHGEIKLPAGTYRVGKEREKDWFSLSVRQVVD